MDAMMNEARFAALLEAYGAAPARWPAGERAAAQAFMAGQPARARALLAEAAALDAALDAAPAQAASERLVAAVLAAAPARPVRPSPWAWLGQGALGQGALGPRLAAASAAALMLGVFAGYASGMTARGDAAGEALVSAAFAEPITVFDIEEG